MNSRFLILLLLVVGVHANAASFLDAAIDGVHRTAAFQERDRYRHPRETLQFLGLRADMTVVEIWPSRGWYTEILAPALREKGKLYAAGFCIDAKRPPQWRKDMARELITHFESEPEMYGRVTVTELSIPECTEIAPAESADMVLTFRNVHNWLKGEYEDGVFAAMYAALKPGGVLGIVEHRAAPGTSLQQMIESGYVTEAKVKELAAKAGFDFIAHTEVNANPKDTKDHPRGVWTLPPSLRLKDQDRDKYLAIGESDRMTLKFVKPVAE
ncbi:MAG: methyltransferase [Gammaproteobacteria bacterium]